MELTVPKYQTVFKTRLSKDPNGDTPLVHMFSMSIQLILPPVIHAFEIRLNITFLELSEADSVQTKPTPPQHQGPGCQFAQLGSLEVFTEKLSAVTDDNLWAFKGRKVSSFFELCETHTEDQQVFP